MTQKTDDRPLAGLRCLSLAQNLPGPLAVQMLAAEGMEVRKIEPPQGDLARMALGGWYKEFSAGVAVDVLDLRSDAGKTALQDALREADLLITSQRRSALARLGITLEALQELAPDLCWVEIVGDEAAPDVPGHDLTYQAEVGLLAPPAMPTTLVADIGGSQRAAFAAMSLLMGRARGGSARHRAVGLKQAAEYFAAPLRHKVTRPGDLLGGALPQYRIYATRDGWAAVGAIEPHFTARMNEHFGADPTEQFSRMSNDEIEVLARDHDIPVKTFHS